MRGEGLVSLFKIKMFEDLSIADIHPMKSYLKLKLFGCSKILSIYRVKIIITGNYNLR